MRRSFGLARALALGLLVVACADEGKRNTRACDTDADCDGGVCFDARCFAVCEDGDDCVASELCVREVDADGLPAQVCVSAAEYAGCTSSVDCDHVVLGPCEAVTCDGASVCAVAGAVEGFACTTAAGAAGACRAGLCEPAAACVAEPGGEVCDGRDNDCDLQTDEVDAPLCSAGLGCYDGACRECWDGNDVDWDGCREGQRVERSVPTDLAEGAARPAVAGSPDGGYVVAWHSPGPDGDLQRVRARTFGPDGVGGAVWAVNAESDVFALDVALAPGGTADLVALWDASLGAETLRARLFAGDGTPAAAEFAALDEAAVSYAVLDSALAGRAGQGFVLAWTGWDGGSPMSSGLSFARFAADGTAEGGVVVASADEGVAYTSPRLAMQADGAFWLACQEYTLSAWSRLAVSRFSATGERTLGPVAFAQVPSSAGPQQNPDVALAADGGVLVVHDVTGHGAIEAQRLDAAGQAQGVPLTVETAGADVTVERPHLVSLGADRLLAVWKRAGPADAGGIGARVLTTAGEAAGDVLELTGGLAGFYGEPRAASLATGGAAVAWEHCPPGEDAVPSYDGQGCSLMTLRLDAAGNRF